LNCPHNGTLLGGVMSFRAVPILSVAASSDETQKIKRMVNVKTSRVMLFSPVEKVVQKKGRDIHSATNASSSPNGGSLRNTGL